MVVTKIEKLTKGRYRIFIDNGVSFALYHGELHTYKISENSEVNQETYDRIMSEVLIKRARLRAMNLLMKHSFTERGLRDKLSDGYYPEEIIDDALNYVISFGYVDDRAYALDYVESHREDKSIARIRLDLSNKGIDKDTINDVLNEIMESDDPVDEMGQINKLLEKRHFDSENATYEEIRRQSAYLAGKGFSSEMIRKAMARRKIWD